MSSSTGSRLHAPAPRNAVLLAQPPHGAAADDGLLWIRSPGVGYWRNAPALGTVVSGGDPIGELEVLGVRHPLIAPAGASGRVVAAPAEGPQPVRGAGLVAARARVDFHSVLLCLDPSAHVDAASSDTRAGGPGAGSQAIYFRAPTSGRYYGRPGPGKAAFCQVGDVIGSGTVIALLEVMKTFHRVSYGGAGLPERARVVRILPEEESDVNAGDPLVELAPVD